MIAVLSIAEVCARLGCKRRRVFELLADGTLERAPRFGRDLRIYEASVDRALAPTPAAKRKARAPGVAWSRSDFSELLA